VRLDKSRKFLLTFPGGKESSAFAEEIDKHLERTEYITADSTPSAIKKISKEQPHIVVTKISSPDIDGFEIAEHLFSSKKSNQVPVILIGDYPEEHIFVDELVAGKVQFLDDVSDEEKVSQCLSRVLNFITNADGEDRHLRFLSPGDVLMRKGTAAEYVYIVRKGKLEASVTNEGKKTVLGPVDTGEFVGEMAFINGDLRSADVCALTDCELIQVPINMMEKILYYKPTWSKSLMRTLSRRMKVSIERLS
jgi:CheY-like chemotaxis protein